MLTYCILKHGNVHTLPNIKQMRTANAEYQSQGRGRDTAGQSDFPNLPQLPTRL